MTATSSDKQRGSSVESSRCRGVTARKRRPERHGNGIERGPNAVRQIFDRERQEALAGQDDDEKRGDPATRRA